MADVGELPFDWNVEVAWQSGSATDPDSGDRLDLGGNVVDLGFGWNLAGGSLIHRIHGAVTRQSGDGNLTDNKAEGWNALFPRTHGRFGEADYFGANFGKPRLASFSTPRAGSWPGSSATA